MMVFTPPNKHSYQMQASCMVMWAMSYEAGMSAYIIPLHGRPHPLACWALAAL